MRTPALSKSCGAMALRSRLPVLRKVWKVQVKLLLLWRIVTVSPLSTLMNLLSAEDSVESGR